jgi:phenolic acid decarboxylase
MMLVVGVVGVVGGWWYELPVKDRERMDDQVRSGISQANGVMTGL